MFELTTFPGWWFFLGDGYSMWMMHCLPLRILKIMHIDNITLHDATNWPWIKSSCCIVMSTFNIFTLTGAIILNTFRISLGESTILFQMWLDILGSNPSTCTVYTWTNLYGMVHISIRSDDMTAMCMVESHNYVPGILFVHVRRWAAMLFLCLFSLPLCCACWRLMSNMKIGTAAGTYSKCIVLGPFKMEPQQKEKRPQSASVNSHSAPVFFVFVMVWETEGGVPHFIPWKNREV